MNIIQVIVTFLLLAASLDCASQLSVTGLSTSSVLVVGNSFSFNVTAADSTTNAGYNAVFTETDSGRTFIIYDLNPGPTAVTTTIYNLIGTISFQAVATTSAYISTAPFNLVINYPTLSFASPASNAQITYGEAVTLQVDSNSVVYTNYVASFTCSTGIFQVAGLTVGSTYSIVPAGIYGQVVITVSADNSNPATRAMTIAKPTSNIPPAFVPGRMIYYPSVYANMKEDGNLEIVSVKYLTSAPI